MVNHWIYSDLGAADTRLYEFHVSLTEHAHGNFRIKKTADHTAFYGETDGRKFIAIPGKGKAFVIGGPMSDEQKEIVGTLKKEYEKGRCGISDTRLYGFTVVLSDYFDSRGFLVLYGGYRSKNFVMLPSEGIFAEAGAPGDIEYNSKKLTGRIFTSWGATAIAEAVSEHWESVKNAAPAAYNADRQEKPPEIRFTAKKCSLKGQPGYAVSRIHNGKRFSGSFVPEHMYADYCRGNGIYPEILERKTGGRKKSHKEKPAREHEDR